MMSSRCWSRERSSVNNEQGRRPQATGGRENKQPDPNQARVISPSLLTSLAADGSEEPPSSSMNTVSLLLHPTSSPTLKPGSILSGTVALLNNNETLHSQPFTSAAGHHGLSCCSAESHPRHISESYSRPCYTVRHGCDQRVWRRDHA